MYEAHNASAQKCHKRNRESNLYEALHAWFCLGVSKKVFYPDGRILTEKALENAGRLDCDGWLDCWKNATMSGR